MSIKVEAYWYVQKGNRVQGPFTQCDMRRFLLLGRVRITDNVSQNGDNWEPVTQVPELISDELLNLHAGELYQWLVPVEPIEPEPAVEIHCKCGVCSALRIAKSVIGRLRVVASALEAKL